MELKLADEQQKKISTIAELIKEKKTFIITSHFNIDGDALGSELAFFSLLKRLNKEVLIINQDDPPVIYKFLPYYKQAKLKKNILRRKFDVGVILDCGNGARAGESYKEIKKASVIINIDHHLTNSGFGNINWVNHQYSSTGEMVYFILKKFGAITKEEAQCIYTAILTDTGCFIHHISKYTMKIIHELIENGATPERIAEKIYMEKPLKFIRLLTLCLNNIKFDRKNKACWFKITRDMYNKTNTTEEDTEGLVDFLLTIKEAKIAFLLKEKNNGVKASLRSKGAFSVEKLARDFDGGGHRQASGCYLKNLSLEEAEKKILEGISKYGRNTRYK
jgi:bifunctional oligoribonuclease and PAP phosphatase NrnA